MTVFLRIWASMDTSSEGAGPEGEAARAGSVREGFDFHSLSIYVTLHLLMMKTHSSNRCWHQVSCQAYLVGQAVSNVPTKPAK